MSQIKFFQPADGGEWHAYREESAQALCGEAQLSYNRDRVADEVPIDGALHDGCRQAIDAESLAPYAPYVATETAADGEADHSASDVADAAAAEITDTESTDAVASDDAAPTETQEVTDGDVASVASVLGEPEPPADQPPA